MSDETQINGSSRLQKLADSQSGKLFVTYILPVVFVILGYFIQDKLTTINATTNKLWTEMGKLNDSQSELKSGVAVSAAAFSAHVREDDTFENQIKQLLQDHETRLRAREQADAFSPRLKLPQH